MSTAYRIHLKPVYSQTVATPKGLQIPENWQLSWHQVETWKALQDPNIDVVINTAMTGDGKSLAAQLGILQGEYNAIALYPTNELARDQELQTQNYIAKFLPINDPRVTRLNSAELEIYAETEKISKAAAISTLSSQREILLTNPDLFHYLHRGAYIINGSKGDSPDKLWNRLDKDFDLFIFDEFHIYQAPQIASTINTMLLIRATNRRKKFLFLSATPEPNLINRLEIAEFRCKVVNPIAENKYQFPDTLAIEQELKAEKWRQVAREIELNFIALEPVAKPSENWLKANAESILNYFLEHSGSKGAIILNSIAAVKRLVPLFRYLFEEHGLQVSENTGLSGKTERERSLSANLVIGTSTIDVGVDFKINYLIFESADAGNFIQRLGRIGRHSGYARDGKSIDFNRFTAVALVPNFLGERLFLGEAPPLVADYRYDRPYFNDTINANYRQIESFQNYYQRWGAVQSFKLGCDLNHRNIQEQYAESRTKFLSDCEITFNTSIRQVAGKVKSWREDWLKLSGQTNGNPIVEDACSFRGGSALLCGIYDATEVDRRDRYKTYDLPGILSNIEIEMWTEAGFRRSLESASTPDFPIPRGRFNYCLAFMKLKGYREERSNWKFHYSGSLESIASEYKVRVLKGLEVWQPDNRWVGEINKRLRNEALVSYIIPHNTTEVRYRLRLPMHFQIYPISDRNSFQESIPPYSIAFGQSALLLDTLAYRFRGKGGELWIV
jgi:CRISPR-associated endonuclease/helicase Cas3